MYRWCNGNIFYFDTAKNVDKRFFLWKIEAQSLRKKLIPYPFLIHSISKTISPFELESVFVQLNVAAVTGNPSYKISLS